MRRSRPDRRLVGCTVLAVFGLLLTAGCAAMPADGSPERVEPPKGGDAGNLQVRVIPVPPHRGEDPLALLAGFLDASNADEAGAPYATAKSYLTDEAAKRWLPDAGVAVLAGNPEWSGTLPAPGDAGFDVTLTGSQVAQVDGGGTYRAVAGDSYQQTFTFVKETGGPDRGEWRIDQLPNGLIIDQTNFKNGYRPVHRYYYTAGDPSAAHPAAPVLVPDPIYLRRRADPLTVAAQALAEGPSDWLAPAVSSSFDQVKIKGGVTIDDSRVARVRVSIPDFDGRQQLCQQMAGQLFYTLLDEQGKGQLDRLELSGNHGGCSVTAAQTAAIAPGGLAGSAGTEQFYQSPDTGQLELATSDTTDRPVPGALGRPTQPRMGALAVRRDGEAAAAVSEDGQALYLVDLADGVELGQPVVTSRAPQPGQGLTSPSWDGRQDLFLADADPADPRVLMVRGRTVVTAQIDDLGGRTVQSLRVSSDGTRIALVLQDATGARTLLIGVVVHGGSATAPELHITGLRPVAPLLSDVQSVSWADPDQLLVLGTEPGKLRQLHYLDTDGSQSTDSPLQGGEGMTAVSATESRAGDTVPPVLAVSADHQIYRLQGTQWAVLAHHGTSFGYPG